MVSEFRSKKDYVYQRLREDIVNGKYKPSSRLVIDDIAREIKVSSIPIREAIQQLEADGFVTVEMHVGARVAEIDATFIFEVFALLEAMEIICSRSACTMMSAEQLDTLANMVTAMDKVVHEPETWAEQNKAMHLYLCDCAKTTLVLKMMQKVFDHWDRLRRHYLQDVAGNRIAEAQEEHHRILAAFRQGKPDAVEAIIREHNQNALKSYTRHLESAGYLVPAKG